MVQMRDEYYNKNFKKSKEEVDTFIEKEFRKVTFKTIQVAFRYFLLENALYNYKKKDTEQIKMLESICKISDGFDFVLENLSKIALKGL